jgi:hypothetical protein
MIKFIKSFFVKKDQPVAETAPYKVPEPAATTPIPYIPEQASQAVIESIVPAKKTPAAKKPRTPKAAK